MENFVFRGDYKIVIKGQYTWFLHQFEYEL